MTVTMTAEEALLAMGITPEDEAESERAAQAAGRDGRICVCGHPMSRHQQEGGPGTTIICRPSRLVCKCREPYPVLEVSNTRPFMCKTTGSGLEHALQMGIKGCRKKGIEIRWVVPLACEKKGCGGTEGVQAVPVSDRGVPLPMESKTNAMFCAKCRAGVPIAGVLSVAEHAEEDGDDDGSS
jgi:hypothetical protein